MSIAQQGLRPQERGGNPEQGNLGDRWIQGCTEGEPHPIRQGKLHALSGTEIAFWENREVAQFSHQGLAYRQFNEYRCSQVIPCRYYRCVVSAKNVLAVHFKF